MPVVIALFGLGLAIAAILAGAWVAVEIEHEERLQQLATRLTREGEVLLAMRIAWNP